MRTQLYAIKTAKKADFPVCAVYDPAAKEDWESITELSDVTVKSFKEAKVNFSVPRFN